MYAHSKMDFQETDGIIVRSYPSGDNNLVIRVISAHHGKICFFASHARRSHKRFGGLDLFDHGTFYYLDSDRGLAKLKEFKSKSAFPNLRTSYDRIVCAEVLAESLDLFTPENDHNATDNYLILHQGLSGLETAADLKAQLKVLYQTLFSLLKSSGVLPQRNLELASAKNLLVLLSCIEQHGGKALATKLEIMRLLRELKNS